MMKNLNNLKFVLGISLFMFSNILLADRFDSAVNLYLKGFEYCTYAKTALNENKLSVARNAFSKYQAFKKQAIMLDKSILNSTEREMDSHLKYCSRVSSDIEIAIGTPLFDQAMAACEKAELHLENGAIEKAQQHYGIFITAKAEALNTSPKLNDLFNVRSQLHRCERLDKKISNSNQEQEAIQLAIEDAIDSSKTYVTLCLDAQQTLNTRSLSKQLVIDTQQHIKEASELKQQSRSDQHTLTALESQQYSQQFIEFQQNLSSGDQCIQVLRSELAAKKNQLASADTELTQIGQQIRQSNRVCQSNVRDNKQRTASTGTLSVAESSYQLSLQAKNAITQSLTKSTHYQNNKHWPQVKKINSQLAQLDQCLAQSKQQLTRLKQPKTKITLATAIKPESPNKIKPAPAIPQPPSTLKKGDNALFKATIQAKPAMSQAVNTQAGNSLLSNTPAKEIQGLIKLHVRPPKFALLYMLDGIKFTNNTEVTLSPSSFDQPFYVSNSKHNFKITNSDFAPHSIRAYMPQNNFNKTITRIRPNQSRFHQITWPDNSIVTLASDRPQIQPAYFANIPTKNYQLLPFNEQRTLTFFLENPNQASSGYVLIPGMDPLLFKLKQGETQEKQVIALKKKQGLIQLKGI